MNPFRLLLSRIPHRDREQGYTLSELFLIISILAVLAGFGMPFALQLSGEQGQTEVKASVESTVEAVQQKVEQTGQVPTKDEFDRIVEKTTGPDSWPLTVEALQTGPDTWEVTGGIYTRAGMSYEYSFASEDGVFQERGQTGERDFSGYYWGGGIIAALSGIAFFFSMRAARLARQEQEPVSN